MNENTIIGMYRAELDSKGIHNADEVAKSMYNLVALHINNNVYSFLQEKHDEGFPAMYYNWLMQNCDNAVTAHDGSDGVFQYGPSTDICYTVDPGHYLLVAHCNDESDENDFSIAIYSEQPIETQ